MRKIFSQKAAAKWQESNPATKSIMIEYDRCKNETLTFKNGIGQVFVAPVEATDHTHSRLLRKALCSVLRNDFNEFFEKIQSLNFKALSYWQGNQEQTRWSKNCEVSISHSNFEDLELIFNKIGFELKEVYREELNNEMGYISLWAINPAI